MALIKREYTDNETVITAENLNDIQDAIIELEDGLFIVDDERSGSVISIRDAAKRSFRSFNIYGKTTQDGTPTPAAPVALVSAGDKGNIKLNVTGKNLLPYPFYQSTLTLNGVTYTDNKDGTLLISGTTTDPSSFWFTGYNFPLKKGVTYTLSIGDELTATGGPYLWINSSKKGIVTGINMTTTKTITFTPEMDYSDAGVYISASKAGMTFSGKLKPQIEVGAGATPFEVYKAQKLTIATPNGFPGIPVSTGGNYTDASGQQWICDEIDLARGVYVQRIGKVDMGELSWLLYKDSVFVSTDNIIPDRNGIDIDTDLMCSIYAPDTTASDWQYVSNNGVLLRKGAMVANTYSVCVKDTRYTSASEFTGAVLGVQLFYVLATPTETPLSVEELNAYAALHTYKEFTTVSNDSLAHMDLEYVMDAKKYIDSRVTGGMVPATVE